MQSNPVGWFEIYVQDMRRAKTFYETVFSTKLEKLSDHAEGHGTHRRYRRVGAEERRPASGNSVIVYFMCEDCANESKKAATNGGKVMKYNSAIGQHGFIALVNDTEGNVIGLHSMK
jgi:uncharacterized protein